MVVGFAADGRADRVMGIDASAKAAQTRDQIYRIAKQTAEKVELDPRHRSKEYRARRTLWRPGVWFAERRDDGRYPPVRQARRCVDRSGLRRQVYASHDRQGAVGEFPTGSKVLYAHLGGVPALNGYSFLFRNG